MNFGDNTIPLQGRRVKRAHLTVPWDGVYYEDVTKDYQGSILSFTLPVGGVISFELQ
jgi:hypothetical protein